MSNIDEIREMVANAKIKKAVKELRALVVNTGLKDDYEDQLVALQSRIASHENPGLRALKDPRDVQLEDNQIKAALSYYISEIEDDLPEDPNVILINKLKEEIKNLTEFISEKTDELEFLRDRSITQADPTTEFSLKTKIERSEKELDQNRDRLGKLKAELQQLLDS